MWNVVVIMPILGITWLFGVLAVNSEQVVFQYIFAVANSLQVRIRNWQENHLLKMRAVTIPVGLPYNSCTLERRQG